MLRIAVIGGGIAGLATALFGRQRGYDIPVYDKNRGLECEDNLLWIAPNGLRLLEALGLFEAFRAKAVPQEVMAFATRDLTNVLALEGPHMRAATGHTIMAIRRRDLYGLLLEEFQRQGGTVHFGMPLRTLSREGQTVRLAFEGSTSDPVYDVVVAADGIGSVARKVIFPKSHVKYQGLRTYLGYSVTDVASRFVGRTIETWGVSTRFVLTSLDGRVCYFSAIERPKVYERNSDPIPADLPERLAGVFADYHPDIREVVRTMVPKSVHRCNFGVVDGLPSLYSQGVFLVGDAAHGMPPNMGQGASLGLEDAYCVVDALKRHTTIDGAGMAYANDRKPRTRKMMNLANAMNWAFQPKGRVGSWLRDHLVPLLPAEMNRKGVLDLYQVPFPIEAASFT